MGEWRASGHAGATFRVPINIENPCATTLTTDGRLLIVVIKARYLLFLVFNLNFWSLISNKYMKYICISLLVLASAMAEAKIPNSAWKSGVLTRVSKEHVARQSGELGKKPPKHGVYIRYYFIQADKSLYEGDDVKLKNNEKGFPISVNAPVKFFLDANDLYIQDNKGKAHKLRLVNVLPTEATAAQ